MKSASANSGGDALREAEPPPSDEVEAAAVVNLQPTEAMRHHYSTVNGAEQRAAIAKVIRLVDHRSPVAAGGEETQTG